MSRGTGALGLAILAIVRAVGVSPAAAQMPELRGYYLNVATGNASGPFNDSGIADLQRLRLMLAPVVGPVAFDVAYEHGLELTSSSLAPASFLGLAGSGGGGDWLPLQGTLDSGAHGRWRHRLDRLSATLALGGSAELTIGRQPISWATTLFLTPADPFVPFDPEDPFREYRAGVDAARLRAFPGPFTDIDVVVRPSTFGDETTLTALARVHTVVRGVELAGWAGALHDEAAAAVSGTATLVGAALRGELVVRRVDEETRFRGVIGLDRAFSVGDRDLYVVLEYQRDGLGAAGPEDIPATLLSPAAARGELLVLGRDSGALQASMQLHPLWTVDALMLANLGDPSALFGPGVTYSIGGDTTARAGVFLGAGADRTAVGGPGSEYGIVPIVGYVSLTAFF